METEYDEDPIVASQTAGDRSAQQFTINLGERSIATVSRASFVAGACGMLCIVCAGIAWWSITTSMVILNHQTKIEARLESLEKDNAVR